jgi:putative oxidoreductase
MLTSLGKYRDFAPTVLRVLLGLTLVFAHGLPKVMEPERWENTGRAMASIGITFMPVFWGFMAGATELLAGILFLIGLAVRPSAALMVFVMFVAAAQSVMTVGNLGGGRAHPVDFAAGAIALMILGAGAYSLDRKLGLDRPRAEEQASRRSVAV